MISWHYRCTFTARKSQVNRQTSATCLLGDVNLFLSETGTVTLILYYNRLRFWNKFTELSWVRRPLRKVETDRGWAFRDAHPHIHPHLLLSCLLDFRDHTERIQLRFKPPDDPRCWGNIVIAKALSRPHSQTMRFSWLMALRRFIDQDKLGEVLLK